MAIRKHIFGTVCVATTYLCICYVDYAVTVHMIVGATSYSVWGLMNIVFYNVILGMLVLAHIRAMMCDPGTVTSFIPNHHNYAVVDKEKYRQIDKVKEWTICMTCQAMRPPRAYHCNICGRCIKQMDHHCPWINNCIGEQNQKYLLIFVFYVVVASMYTATMISVYWIEYILDPPHFSSNMFQTKLMHTVMLSFISVGFSVFAFAVGSDLLMAVKNQKDSETVTESNRNRSQISTKEACYEVFGEVHPLLWMIPFSPGRRGTGPKKSSLEA